MNNETVTRGIKHWGLSGYANILPRIKFGVSGQESSTQSPTISYRHPLWASVSETTNGERLTANARNSSNIKNDKNQQYDNP